MKNIIKKTLIYKWLRKQKGKTLDRNYINLLNKVYVNKSKNETLSCFNKKHIKTRSANTKPVIVGVGHTDWEQYGFWKAFETHSDFYFFELKSSLRNLSLEMQTKFSLAILEFVEEITSNRGKIDIVFFYCDASYLNRNLLIELNDRDIYTVMMGLDDKHRFQEHKFSEVNAGQELVIPYIDIYWTTWKSIAVYLQDSGIKSIYLAEGADPVYHKKKSLDKDIDVLFLGNAYGERKETIDFLISNGIHVMAYGAGWKNGFVTFDETINLYNRSKIVLGVGGVGHSLNFKHLKGRDFEATMCGSFYLTSFNPELTDWFEIGKEIVCYSSKIEMLELIYYYLKHDEEREIIAENALSRSLRDHTWTNRINALLENIYEPS